MRKRSAYEYVGLPENAQYVIFVIALLLFLAPYLAGIDFGVVKIPKLAVSAQAMTILGPILLVGAVLGYARFFPSLVEYPTNSSRALAYASREKLRFGLSLGWQLGRFEFVDGAEFVEAQEAAPLIRAEIVELLNFDGFPKSIERLNYRELVRIIISHYAVVDIEKHAAILVGIAGMRVSLIGSSSRQDHNFELSKLALSALHEADHAVISDKDRFFEQLIEASPRTITDLAKVVETACR